MNEKKINVGDLVEDQVTKFKGIVMAYSTWITGCDTVLITKQLKPRDSSGENTLQVDVTRIKVLKKKAVVIENPYTQENGGPQTMVKQR